MIPRPDSRYLSKWRPATSVRGQLSARRSTRRELDFTWEVHHQRVGRESVSATHEVHEPFGEIISVHAAWGVGGGGACSEMISPTGSRFIWHPGENVKTDSGPGNNFL